MKKRYKFLIGAWVTTVTVFLVKSRYDIYMMNGIMGKTVEYLDRRRIDEKFAVISGSYNHPPRHKKEN